MSSSHYVYLGIYLKCTKNKTIEVEGRKRCSKDKDHTFNVYHDTHFCPICGSPVEREMETQSFGWLEAMMEGELVDKISQEEFKLLDDSFYQMGYESCEEGTEILVPITDKVFGINIGEDEGDFEVDMSKGIIFPDLAEQCLARQIDILKRVLYSDIEVKFGYISQWG